MATSTKTNSTLPMTAPTRIFFVFPTFAIPFLTCRAHRYNRTGDGSLRPATVSFPGHHIITYAASDEGDVTVTHRLVRLYENEAGQAMMVTKGDANDREDSPVLAARMIGIVTGRLPYMGTVAGFIRQNLLLVAFNLAVLAAAILGIRHLLRGRNNTGKHNSQPMMEE